MGATLRNDIAFGFFFFSLYIKTNTDVLVNAEVQQNQTELFVMEYHYFQTLWRKAIFFHNSLANKRLLPLKRYKKSLKIFK